MTYPLVERLSDGHSVQRLCAVLGVSRSGYYAWRCRPATHRAREDRRLKQQILSIHTKTKGRYGTPRIEQSLRRGGVRTSRKRVARLRRELGLRARTPRRFRVTTDSNHSKPPAPNLLQRRFAAPAPDRTWVGDITYLSTPGGWVYLAFLMDTYSRRIVGWSVSSRIDEELCLAALRKALGTRRPPAGMIHHTDRGSQYCARDYRRLLAKAGLVVSMSRKGDCWDNAMAESLVKTIKVELGDHFSSRLRAEQELFEYIEGFYNTCRLHSSLGYNTPLEVEREAARQEAA
jgi:transposase InsO family protein